MHRMGAKLQKKRIRLWILDTKYTRHAFFEDLPFQTHWKQKCWTHSQPNPTRCDITLSSWTTENRRLELDFDGEDDINFLTFRESNEWMLVDSSATKDNLIYHVFEKEEPMKYTRLTYSMTIRRHFGFYVYALIVYICVYVTCTLSVYLS